MPTFPCVYHRGMRVCRVFECVERPHVSFPSALLRRDGSTVVLSSLSLLTRTAIIVSVGRSLSPSPFIAVSHTRCWVCCNALGKRGVSSQVVEIAGEKGLGNSPPAALWLGLYLLPHASMASTPGIPRSQNIYSLASNGGGAP